MEQEQQVIITSKSGKPVVCPIDPADKEQCEACQ